MYSTDTKIREAICRLGASIFGRGLTPGSSGNISVRVDDGWLMTPTNASLGELDPATLSKLDDQGRLVSGDKETKESFLHLAVYDVRASAGAIVHLHSTHSVAVSCLADERLRPAPACLQHAPAKAGFPPPAVRSAIPGFGLGQVRRSGTI
jgi:ribulose-5-phosphate 4-epimerase/fuculose-1-phosphate aldolase